MSYTSKLYNIHLEERTCIELRILDPDGYTVEKFCEQVLKAAIGLDDPYIDLDARMDYDVAAPIFAVAGKRALTDAEYDTEVKVRENRDAQRQHMAALKLPHPDVP